MPSLNRIHIVKLDSYKEDELLLESLNWTERLGEPYRAEVNLVSTLHEIDGEEKLGKPMSVIVEPKKNEKRYFGGVITEFDYVGVSGKYSCYRIVLRPKLWLLTNTRNCCIFQDKSTKEIVTEVLKTNGVDDFQFATDIPFEKRSYCCQYQESDFDFVTRLLEEEGVWYYITQEKNKQKIVFCNKLKNSQTAAIYDKGKLYYHAASSDTVDYDCISGWSIESAIQSGKVVLNDYDFEKPSSDLTESADVEGKNPRESNEVFDFPARATKPALIRHYADVRAQRIESQRSLRKGVTDALGLTAGAIFKLSNFPRNDQNDVEFSVIEVITSVVSGELEFTSKTLSSTHTEFAAVKSVTNYRPPISVEKPVVVGPQSAIVVGKSGEEIWTDEFGRVKVQFYWDRIGELDENSSCWLRVSQNWAGKGWGAIHIPRIGQEVLVEFLCGDPDRPIVTGRVYNKDVNVPYALPTNQTQSGIKSRSTKKGQEDEFNELRFEDKKGEEEVYFHAQKDFKEIVENDQVIEIGKDQTVKIKDNQSITIEDGDYTLVVSKGKAKIQAAESIELIVGQSSIKIEPAKITLKSTQIEVKADASAKIEGGASAEVSAGGVLTLKGALVKIN